MSSTQLYRLSGFALLASGVVSVIGYGIGTFQSDTDVSALAAPRYDGGLTMATPAWNDARTRKAAQRRRTRG